MFNLNRVVIMGNLTKSPILNQTKKGINACTLNIALNHYYDGKEEPYFFDVMVYGDTALNCCKYLEVGRKVIVDGKLIQRRWETKDGEKRNKVEILAQKVIFVGGSRSKRNNKQDDDQQSLDEEVNEEIKEESLDDDIPF